MLHCQFDEVNVHEDPTRVRPSHGSVGYGLAPAAGAVAAEGVVLLPSECTLSTPESRQPLIVQEIEHGEVGRQRVAGIEWSSSDPKIATVVDGIVTPVHDGQATITAKVGCDVRPRPRSWWKA